MRYMIIGGAVLAALLASPLAASAQSGENEAYCSTIKGSQNAAPMRCSFKTMAQCEESVKDGQGTCTKNPKM
jgi:uncharacterized protein DUF3551